MYLFGYVGGKYFARKQIFDILESEKAITFCDDWIEPFVGAGSILFKAMQKKLARNYYANDLNSDLINLYNNFNGETIAKFLSLGEECLKIEDKTRFRDYYKNVLQNYNSSEVKESYIFLFLANLCYGGKIIYRGENIATTPDYATIRKDLFLINRKKMYSEMLELMQNSNVKFFNYDYREFLSTTVNPSKKQIIFLDPPYEGGTIAYNTDKKGIYNAKTYLTEFKLFKNENNTMLITIKANEEDVYDVFGKNGVKYYALNICKCINYRYNKREKINDCLIIVR